MKKGFTIIELIISISIISIIFILSSKNLIVQLSGYKDYMNNYKEALYMEQGFIYIEEKLKEGNIQVLNSNNNDEILVTAKEKNNCIKYYREKIIISYENSNYTKTTNNIIVGVKGFKVLKVENTLFIKIISKSGGEYERCFGIKAEKDL